MKDAVEPQSCHENLLTPSEDKFQKATLCATLFATNLSFQKCLLCDWEGLSKIVLINTICERENTPRKILNVLRGEKMSILNGNFSHTQAANEMKEDTGCGLVLF